jgi:hypothetical protein
MQRLKDIWVEWRTLNKHLQVFRMAEAKRL